MKNENRRREWGGGMSFFLNLKKVYWKAAVAAKKGGIVGVYKAVINCEPLYIYLCKLFNKKVVRSFYGIKVRANYEDITFRIYVQGGYGTFYSSLVQGIEKDFVYLDIGANQGLYTILAAKNPFCKKVIAFEPVSRTFELLSSNCEINGVSKKTRLLNKAVSDVTGTSKITLVANHSGAAGLPGRSGMEGTTEETIDTVNHQELNRLIESDNLDIVVKIDTEGHDEVVLQQLFQTKFFGRIQQLFFECDERWVDVDSIIEQLKDNQFHVHKTGSGAHYDVLAARAGYETAVRSKTESVS